MKSFFKLLLFLLILLIGFSGLAVYWTFYKPLPEYSGEQQLEGLTNRSTIHWDNNGVPHIFADNREDIFRSMGYVHAQDRLWQMTVSQLVAEGRMAEFLGPDALSFDKHQRTLGIWEVAGEMEKNLPDSVRSLLQAYADGVNSYVNSHQKQLPVQFAIVNMEPIPWTVRHTLAMSRLMAWEMNISWMIEPVFHQLTKELSDRQMQYIWPDGIRRRYSVNKDGNNNYSGLSKSLMSWVDEEYKFRDFLGQEVSHIGSNTWVADGSKTETGMPLLAGDPHLGLNMPGKWYEIHTNVDGFDLSGATIPGAPFFLNGQNEQMAWSITLLMADATDFYLEQINPQDRSLYVVDSVRDEAVYQELEIDRHRIKVNNGDEEILTVRSTKHGPIISDIHPADSLTGDRAISIAWTGHEPGTEARALLAMNWARNFKQFREGAKMYDSPALNFSYADKSNNIALLSRGRIPIRSGNPLMLRKGWNESHDWQGYIPRDELPQTINPEKGWIANANNPVHGPDYPHYISAYWEPLSRYNRISNLLEQDSLFSPDFFKTMQNDTYSRHSNNLAELIVPVLNSPEYQDEFATIISYLNNWDFTYETRETAASILDVFLVNLSRNTLEDEMTEQVYNRFIKLESLPVRTMDRLLQNRQETLLFDDKTTPKTETREDIIVKSMREAKNYLIRNFGSEPYEWRWENLHTITFEPLLFSKIADDTSANRITRLIVNNLLKKGPYPVRGHGMSINNGQYRWTDPYEMYLGPSIRRVTDLSNLSYSWSILPTGQSGNPLSDYYGDQTERWLTGRYKKFYQDSLLLEEATYRTTILKPRGKIN